MKEDIKTSACYLLLNGGKNMLTHFLMVLPGGLDFCLGNVFLECISVSSSSCPASYQRPACVCSRRKMLCVWSACLPSTY